MSMIWLELGLEYIDYGCTPMMVSEPCMLSKSKYMAFSYRWKFEERILISNTLSTKSISCTNPTTPFSSTSSSFQKTYSSNVDKLYEISYLRDTKVPFIDLTIMNPGSTIGG